MDEDARLMLLVSRGDIDAFRSLVERYQAPIYNFFLRSTGSAEDAEDLSQQLFIKLYQAADRYSPRSAFRTYIYRIASNLARSFARKLVHRRTVSLDTMPEGASSPAAAPGGIDPVSHIEEVELGEAYRRALLALPSYWRTALELRVGRGLSYGEISEVMGKSVSSVESMLFRARERLAHELRAFMDDNGEL
jgi:RNA polymerase sigma-70 factor (ECF subfamily)